MRKTGLRVGFICHRYHDKDIINGSLVGWVDELAKRVKEVYLLTLDRPKQLPTRSNIYMNLMGSRSTNKIKTALRFIRITRSTPVDCFFIWQGGHYPALLKLTGKPVFQWKAHPRVEWWQDLYSRYCNNITFTSTPYSYPGGGRVEVVGHGVDCEHFRPMNVQKTWDYLMVGRVSRSKKIEKAAKLVGDKTLVCVGPCLTKDDYKYKVELYEVFAGKRIMFLGSVTRDRMPLIYNRAKVLLNFSVTALDRSVLEAMACGVTVHTTNKCAQYALEQGIEAHSLETIWDRILPFMVEECELY